MNTVVTKYLYLSRNKDFGKITARISSNKNEIQKSEICLKLNLNIDTDVFLDTVPAVTIDVPKDYKSRTLNLRIS